MRYLLATLVIVTGLLAASVPAPSGSDAAAAEDLEQNRLLLKQWRADPEHWKRLQHDFAVFRSLPSQQQERLRQLDHELAAADSVTQARLVRVMERYGDWLSRLPEADRHKIASAATPQERLRRIKELREQRWVERLPRARRELLQGKDAKERAALIQLWRQESQQQREEWRLALRHWDDVLNQRTFARLTDYPADVQAFVKDQLRPMLTKEEEEALERAEGHWPQFPATLVKLADKHPIRLPGPTTGPARLQDLPGVFPPETAKRVTQQLRQADLRRLRNLEGKWPDFGITLLEIVNQRKGPNMNLQFPAKVAPSHPADFPPAQQKFIEEKLLRALDSGEKELLAQAEGQWPAYPRLVMELAGRHKLTIPGMALPGNAKGWERYRSLKQLGDALPEPEEAVLRDFVRRELSPEERAAFDFSFADPVTYEWVKTEYFKRFPSELTKLRQDDQKKAGRKLKLPLPMQ